jgi:hypothetical protein
VSDRWREEVGAEATMGCRTAGALRHPRRRPELPASALAYAGHSAGGKRGVLVALKPLQGG